MSIYGPEPPEAELATGPDNHALKARIDAQVGLRVLKAGDTMTGELQMGENMIRGLPQVYPPSDYLGDEAGPRSWDCCGRHWRHGRLQVL